MSINNQASKRVWGSPLSKLGTGEFRRLKCVSPAKVSKRKRPRRIFEHLENNTISSDSGFTSVQSKEPAFKKAFIAKPFKSCKQDIHNHIDQKITLFYLTLIAVYGRQELYFSIGNTHGQGPCSKQLRVVEQKKRLTLAMNATHSSVIPVLYAYARIGTNTQKGAVYLKGSSYDRRQNSTMDLPGAVNQIDSMLEGKIGQNKLRDLSISIINDAALKNHTPTEGAQKFLKAYQILIKSELEKECRENQLILLNIFKKRINELLECSSSISQLENLFIFPQQLHFKGIHKELIEKKCRYIQEIFEHEAMFGKKVEELERFIHEAFFRRPPFFRFAFIAEALKHAESEQQKNALLNYFDLERLQLSNVLAFSSAKRALKFFEENSYAEEFKNLILVFSKIQNSKQCSQTAHQLEMLNFLRSAFPNYHTDLYTSAAKSWLAKGEVLSPAAISYCSAAFNAPESIFI